MDAYVAIALGAVTVVWVTLGWPRRARTSAWRVIIGMCGVSAILTGSNMVWPDWISGLLLGLAVASLISLAIGLVRKDWQAELVLTEVRQELSSQAIQRLGLYANGATEDEK